MQLTSVLRLAILSKFDKAKTGNDLLALLSQLTTPTPQQTEA